MIRSSNESRSLLQSGYLECGSSAAAFSATRTSLYLASLNK